MYRRISRAAEFFLRIFFRRVTSRLDERSSTNMRNPLMRGGQGRAAREVMRSAMIAVACLVLAAIALAIALCWSLLGRCA